MAIFNMVNIELTREVLTDMTGEGFNPTPLVNMLRGIIEAVEDGALSGDVVDPNGVTVTRWTVNA
jgi:hypothetical protein